MMFEVPGENDDGKRVVDLCAEKRFLRRQYVFQAQEYTFVH